MAFEKKEISRKNLVLGGMSDSSVAVFKDYISTLGNGVSAIVEACNKGLRDTIDGVVEDNRTKGYASFFETVGNTSVDMFEAARDVFVKQVILAKQAREEDGAKESELSVYDDIATVANSIDCGKVKNAEFGSNEFRETEDDGSTGSGVTAVISNMKRVSEIMAQELTACKKKADDIESMPVKYLLTNGAILTNNTIVGPANALGALCEKVESLSKDDVESFKDVVRSNLSTLRGVSDEKVSTVKGKVNLDMKVKQRSGDI